METMSSKPTFYIDSKVFPELKELKLGSEVELIIKVKVTDLHAGEGSAPSSGCLAIQDIMFPEEEEKDVEFMTDKEFLKYAAQEKRKSN